MQVKFLYNQINIKHLPLIFSLIVILNIAYNYKIMQNQDSKA